MDQEIAALVRAMSGEDWDEGLVQRMCETVRRQLESRLRPGVTVKECGGAFPIAAAWMALGALRSGASEGQVESFSAGDLTIRTGGSGRGWELEEQARRLMAPYCQETGFAFQGVKG